MGRESPVYLSDTNSPAQSIQHRNSVRTSQELFYTNPSLFLPPQPALVAGTSTGNDVHVWSPMAAAFHHAHSPFSVLRPHGGGGGGGGGGGTGGGGGGGGHLGKQNTMPMVTGQGQWSSALLSAYMMHLLPVPPHVDHSTARTESPRASGESPNSIQPSSSTISERSKGDAE